MKGRLELRSISTDYGGGQSHSGRPVLSGIDLSVEEGELLVLAGPNGSGKTTLLKTAAGLLAPLEGRVEIHGREIHKLKPRERAAFTAFLFQVRDNPWPFTVRETIAQGRFVRRGWLGAETRADREAINFALEKAELMALAERPITELSGGELQRVYIARSIAQGAAFLLLDEPENNLDPKYAYMILSLIETLVREGRGAIVSLHDLRLAARFAHRVALLSPGGTPAASGCMDGRGSSPATISAIGPPAEVLTEETLSRVFDLPPELVRSMVL